MSTLKIACAAFLALGIGQALALERTPVISTAEGPVQGSVTNQVAAFLGIPYAKPPVGSLRWRSPQAPARWRTVLDASHFGNNCYQSPPQRFGPYTAEFLISPPVSEDCLYLNVWAPAGQSAQTTKRAVYVFIHGGGFGSGSASIPIYDGADLAARGIVVVTINYRLGVFGFLAHPELTKESQHKSSGDYGLEDILAALRWVHANIERFGGDAHNVTIGGQSAGAAAVNDLLVSAPAKGLFQRAIAESGSGMGLHEVSLTDAENYGVKFATAAGAKSIQALRDISADRLQQLAAVPPPATGAASGPPPIHFAPNVDGFVIATRPEADSTLVSSVPLLTGFNTDEGAAGGLSQVTAAAFESDVTRRYQDYAKRLLALYPHASDEEATQSAAILARDRYMASLLIFSQRRQAASGQVIYDYLFDHPYPIPDSDKFRAFHTAEVPYVFGALTQQARTFSSQDHQVSRQLQAYWVDFMQAGDPNGTDLPAWKPAAPGHDDVMELGDHPGTRPAVSSAERLALLKEFVAHGGQLSLF